MLLKSLSDFVSYFDYFGIIFSFKFKGENSYKSRLGGIVFILFLIFSAYYFITALIDFLMRNSYNINYSVTAIKENHTLNFTNSFKFGYALKYKNGSKVNESELPFIKHQISLVSKSGGEIDKKIQTIKIKKNCSVSDFNFTDGDVKAINLKFMNLFNFYCPEDLSNITIQGTFTDSLFRYIEISFSLHEEWLSPYNLTWIKTLLEQNPISYVVTWTDTTVDVKNLQDPFSYYMRSINGYLDFNFVQKLNLDFSEINFKSDSNFFFSNPKNFESITIRQTDNFNLFVPNRIEIKEKNMSRDILKIYLRTAPECMIYDRSYIKFDIFIGNFGGLQTNVFMVLFVIITFLNEFWASQKVMNSIIHFREHLKLKNPQLFEMIKANIRTYKNDEESKRISKMNIELSTMKLDIIQDLTLNKDKSFTDFNEDQDKGKTNTIEKREIETSIDIDVEIRKRKLTSHHKNLFTRQKTSLEKQEEKILSKTKTPLNFNILEIILRICPCKTKKLNLKNKFLEKAKKKMEYYFDIFTYTKKMQEIDIIKYLLLDRDQVKLFDFISTPSVSMLYSDSDDVYEDFLKRTSNKMNVEDLEEIIKSYKLLKNKHEDLNNKLFYLFDYEIDHLLID